MTGLIRSLCAVLMFGTLPALAAPPAVSPMPMPRPEREAAAQDLAAAAPLASTSRIIVDVIEEPVAPVAPSQVRDIEALALSAIDAAVPPGADAPASSPAPSVVALPIGDGAVLDVSASSLAIAASPRPQLRGDVPTGFSDRAARLRAIAEVTGAEVTGADTPRPARSTSDPEFRAWIAAFQARARAGGITQATLDQAFDGVQLDARVLERDRNQAEFSRALWDYLDSAVSSERIANGRSQMAAHRDTLRRIEERYRVEAEVVVAVWGLESAYGAMRGSTDIIEAMASLAYEGRRSAFFEEQLMAALQILQAGDTRPRNMTGSWAGAMGHTQFMPTSYLRFAQDFTGDGRRDIWSDDPVDALASTAHYLAEHGWTFGQPWGLEVRIPDGFDYRLAGEQERIGAEFWNGQGVRLINGDPVPNHGPASILLPAGSQGVALVVYNNFRVIERYNPADAYVIAIGHLSDRIEGGPAFQADWPRSDRALTFDERQELQRRLAAAGHYRERIDGIVGPNTIAAVRQFQAQVGVTPDGYASLAVLLRLRQG